jgi:Cu+-exporting ATPase
MKPEMLVIDPVCGQVVDAEAVKQRSRHEGKTDHFCCEHCKETFETDPKRFAVTEHPVPHY